MLSYMTHVAVYHVSAKFELYDTCCCVPCECRIVNIILPSPICVNTNNHKGCDIKTKGNPSKGVQLHTDGCSHTQKPICPQKNTAHEKEFYC